MNSIATANFDIAATLARAAMASTMTNAAIILTELLNPTNDAAPMDLNLNQLLNSALSQESLVQQTLAQKAIAQLPPELLSRPQVIEALVLQNTLLPAADTAVAQKALPLLQLPLPSPGGAATPVVANTLYRINVQWQNRVLQLLSSEPLPTGSRVPLQITARGEIVLLPPALAAKLLLQQIATQQSILTNTSTPPLAQPTQTQRPTPAQTIQQSLRELLPRQQALHTLVPLLQKFITPSVREQLPQPVFKALAQLLQALPKPAQVTNAENLKQTLNNSGSFFEARLARALMADPQIAETLPKPAQATNAENLKPTLDNRGNFSEALLARTSTADPTPTEALAKPTQATNPDNLKQPLNNSVSFAETHPAQVLATGPTTAEALPKIFASDLKAQIGALLEIIRKFTPDAPARATTLNTEDDFIYTGKPALPQTAAHSAPREDSDDLDVLLTQLSKLLQAGFARIQLNQLDSASARHVTHEAQAPVPTWVLELPLRTPHGVDQLQLRIEQRRKQQQQHTRVQWNVEIAFDLHAAGKLAATLAIVDKTVSAMLWAEREHTHRRVREEMDYLRAGLESVGVKVTEMQCRLGLPAPRSRPISQQLVDVHT